MSTKVIGKLPEVPALNAVAQVLLVHPCGWMQSGIECAESVARHEAALEMIRREKVPSNIIIPLTAGYGKKNPADPYRTKDGQISEGAGESLAGQQAEYLRKRPETKEATIIVRPEVWSTKSEIEASIGIIAELGYKKARFWIVATSGGHMFRSWMAWSAIHPEGWSAEFYGVNRPLDFRRKTHEAIGIAKYAMILSAKCCLERRVANDYAKGACQGCGRMTVDTDTPTCWACGSPYKGPKAYTVFK